MSEESVKVAAKKRIAELVNAFEKNHSDYIHAKYNETQTRTEFITPLLQAFGWDVLNQSGLSQKHREVIEEATVEVGEERQSKRPDYELRVARQRKMFVEAKKPSVSIYTDRASAFQARRYGYSASMPIVILTNFQQIAVYDCLYAPSVNDEAHVARILLLEFREFDSNFDRLWDCLARSEIYSGNFDKRFNVDVVRRGAMQFDDYFLSQVSNWRSLLAQDIYENTPGLSAFELTHFVQIFLCRIIFLRICEDRDIEKYEMLRNLAEDRTFDALMDELRRADGFYNSGLFQLLDDERSAVRISDHILKQLIDELYYPTCPYTFSVVEAEVLGEIYEQFLGDEIVVESGEIAIVNKPEVRESGGVVPTPGFIAEHIVERSMAASLEGKSPADLSRFTVADITCGSGIFLLACYGVLVDHYLKWYEENVPDKDAEKYFYKLEGGRLKLTFEVKREILINHLRGVDIDSNAVEVAKFSLLLKLIEDETESNLKDFVSSFKTPALPSLDEVILCGNTLVSTEEWNPVMGRMNDSLRDLINPFSWQTEFKEEMEQGGFDVIVGNPPYIRIQKMVGYSPDEVEYFSNPASPFETARQGNFDKYALFVERFISLVKASGVVGIIIPNKFMTIQSGSSLRNLVTRNNSVSQIVDFGTKQVFGKGTSNYTCIVILTMDGSSLVKYESPGPLESWRYGNPGEESDIVASDLDDKPWSFASDEVRSIFARMMQLHHQKLSDVSDISVGAQTSADSVYILNPEHEDKDTVVVDWDECKWPIEKGVLRDCLYDAEVEAFSRINANRYIIFPYKLISTSAGRTKAQLIQPAEMQAKYPLCLKYLTARKAELDDRSITGGPVAERQWYQYGRSQSLIKFNEEKIIFPVLSVEPRYAYDDGNIMFTGGGNGPYYMLQSKENPSLSNLYLMAVLNHPLGEAMVRTNTSVFRGGYYSHGKQFIENLPVPIPSKEKHDEILSLIESVFKLNHSLMSIKIPAARQKVKRQISEIREEISNEITGLFQLSEEELKAIEAVPVPN